MHANKVGQRDATNRYMSRDFETHLMYITQENLSDLIHKHVLLYTFLNISLSKSEGRRGRDRKVVGFSITWAISVHHIYGCEFEPRSWRGVLDTALCDKVCQ